MGRKKETQGGEVRKGACKHCGGDIKRRDDERYPRFLIRLFCSPVCRNAHTNQNRGKRDCRTAGECVVCRAPTEHRSITCSETCELIRHHFNSSDYEKQLPIYASSMRVWRSFVGVGQ